MAGPRRLNQKQILFIAHYLESGNATTSYIAAGYSKNGAEVSACQLLSNPKIQAELEKRRALEVKASRITVASLMDDLSEVKERCLQRVQVLDSQGNPTGEWKFDSKGALKAIELQGRQLGMFQEIAPQKPVKDVTPDLDEKYTTTELVRMLIERRPAHAVQIEVPRKMDVLAAPANGETVEPRDPKPISFTGLQELPAKSNGNGNE